MQLHYNLLCFLLLPTDPLHRSHSKSNPSPLPTNNHIASQPVPIPHDHGGNRDSVVEMTITDESSASTTPVSDTTATDTDSTGVSTIPP